jgi:uroporphyrinogen decarboxylase
VINIENIKIKSKPDFRRMLKVLKRDGKPDRVPFYELFSNIHEKVVGHIIKKENCKDDAEYQYKLRAYYNERLGYDYLEVFSPYKLPSAAHGRSADGTRGGVRAGDSLIGNWEEYEKYPWPKYETINWKDFERAKDYMPKGMKCIAMSPGGIEEAVLLNIMGYEKLCIALYEDPKLVKQIFDNVGACMEYLFKGYVSYDFVGAVIISDDLGFKTQTMLPPDAIRQYIFPWYKKLIKIAHDAGRPVILHSCGNLKEIYEDLIEMGIDAKHSYENVILPVWEFKKKYGNRIAALGGFDVDKICRDNKEEIIKHTRFLIDNCAAKGGYAIGTGNSVADYVNIENFLTMLEEAFNYGRSK